MADDDEEGFTSLVVVLPTLTDSMEKREEVVESVVVDGSEGVSMGCEDDTATAGATGTGGGAFVVVVEVIKSNMDEVLPDATVDSIRSAFS